MLAAAAGWTQQKPQNTALAKATVAAGCFWCVEEAFDPVPGVVSTTSGYMGGQRRNPTYKEVSSGTTGHTEVVQVVYDPAKVSYEKLLEVFWRNVDPTVQDRQFCDVGSQYRPEIFFHTAEQKRLAESSKARLQKTKPFREPILTLITPAGEFWPAEEYHQDYYKKNPVRYRFYKTGCGREARLEQLWGPRGKDK
ncbi:MAG: peptide-methionine (S)-S-oxide reductase [Betaproteobacteria bacterium RIFCSPLOWO2_12_FULL_66_14]|nr:MAG: peptide-methionine (S)-S-oxide reductase [Betaproteobacteria bacterium RIFCSPLOWO2_12_FULL_66_14]